MASMKRNQESALTAGRLRSLLHYDTLTGIFRRRTRSGNAKAGAIAGGLSIDGYWRIRLDGVRYQAHNLAWLYVYGEWPTALVDHRDNVKHHNWIDNLRPATASQNSANARRSARNTSGFKGVSYNKESQSWSATICLNRRTKLLGFFSSPEAAHAAYLAAAADLFGEFANGGDGPEAR